MYYLALGALVRISPPARLSQYGLQVHYRKSPHMKALWPLISCVLLTGCASTLQSRSDYPLHR